MSEKRALDYIGAQSKDELVPVYLYSILKGQLVTEVVWVISYQPYFSEQYPMVLIDPKHYTYATTAGRKDENGEIHSIVELYYLEGRVTTRGNILGVWFHEPNEGAAKELFRDHYAKRIKDLESTIGRYKIMIDDLA